MSTSAIDGGQSTTTYAAATGQVPGLGRDDFLRLLVVQLENQDPLSPMQDREFVSQLATFSSLEQQIQTNANLQNLAIGQANLVNSQALGLIGKAALVSGADTVSIHGGRADDILYALPRPAGSATLTIKAEDGSVVRTFQLDPSAEGRVTLPWDGTGEDGEPLPDGNYRIEVAATDLQGEPLVVSLFRSLLIEGVNFASGGIELISGDRVIPFESIVEIRAGS